MNSNCRTFIQTSLISLCAWACTDSGNSDAESHDDDSEQRNGDGGARDSERDEDLTADASPVSSGESETGVQSGVDSGSEGGTQPDASLEGQADDSVPPDASDEQSSSDDTTTESDELDAVAPTQMSAALAGGSFFAVEALDAERYVMGVNRGAPGAPETPRAAVQFYARSGQAVGEEIAIGAALDDVGVAGGSILRTDDGFAVVWATQTLFEATPEVSYWVSGDVHWSSFDREGNALDERPIVVEGLTISPTSIRQLADGRLAWVFTNQDRVLFQIEGNDPIVIDEPRGLETSGGNAGDASLPSMAERKDGSIVFAWAVYANLGEELQGDDVFIAQLPAGATTVTEPQKASTTDTLATLMSPPSIAVLDSGQVALGWQILLSSYVQVFDTNLSRCGSEIALGVDDDYGAQLFGLRARDNGFLVSWEDMTAPNLGGDGYLQHITEGGSADAPMRLPDDGDVVYDQRRAIALLDDGLVATAWTGAVEQDDASYTNYAYTAVLPLAGGTTESACVAPAEEPAPVVTTPPSDFNACGGDPTGAWNFVELNIAGSNREFASASCAGVPFNGRIELEGEITINPDGSLTTDGQQFVETVVSHSYSEACAVELDGAAFECATLSDFDPGSCTDAPEGGCTCVESAGPNEPRSQMQTYVTSGSTLMLYDSEGEPAGEAEYCVQGDSMSWKLDNIRDDYDERLVWLFSR